VTLRFGVDNLFNKAPPLTGINTANTNPAGTGNLPGGSIGGGIYDTNGRRFYLGANVRF
jgi:outer membrane receptor protein involved in Fe transport